MSWLTLSYSGSLNHMIVYRLCIQHDRNYNDSSLEDKGLQGLHRTVDSQADSAAAHTYMICARADDRCTRLRLLPGAKRGCA